jgi:hypothetical protein
MAAARNSAGSGVVRLKKEAGFTRTSPRRRFAAVLLGRRRGAAGGINLRRSAHGIGAGDLLGEVAGQLVARCEFAESGLLGLAAVADMRAAGVEAATGRWVERARHVALDDRTGA